MYPISLLFGKGRDFRTWSARSWRLDLMRRLVMDRSSGNVTAWPESTRCWSREGTLSRGPFFLSISSKLLWWDKDDVSVEAREDTRLDTLMVEKVLFAARRILLYIDTRIRWGCTFSHSWRRERHIGFLYRIFFEFYWALKYIWAKPISKIISRTNVMQLCKCVIYSKVPTVMSCKWVIYNKFCLYLSHVRIEKIDD